jgi:hypothetical protein
MFDVRPAASRPSTRITVTRHLHTSRIIAILALGILVMIVSTSIADAAGAVYDDFGNGAINSHLWTTHLTGGSSIVENGGGIVATIPANATSPGSSFGAQLISRCELRGDFDVRVDFRLPVWPPTNGVRASLGITGTNAGGVPGVAIIERASLANGEFGGAYSEVYAFDTGAAVAIDGFDLEGTLRLTRVGDTITGYALSGGTWVQVGSNALGPISDARFVLNTFTNDAVFGDVNVQVIYDNVVIEVGQLVNCPSPPTTQICDFEGFLQPVDNPDALNTGRSGRTYPIKWRCTGEDGVYISDLGIVKSIGSQRVSCSNLAYDNSDPLEVSTSGNSALRYDEQSNQFVFNWQTPRSGATECYVFVLVLSDDSVHTANFQLRP